MHPIPFGVISIEVTSQVRITIPFVNLGIKKKKILIVVTQRFLAKDEDYVPLTGLRCEIIPCLTSEE